MATNNHLKNLKSILNEFCSFIESYRAILNNHNVQFLVEDHYLNFIKFDPNLVKSLEEVESKHKNLIKYCLNYELNQYEG
jgi:hypothetical protein